MPGVVAKRQTCSVLTARDRILASTLPQSVKDAAGGMNGGGVDRIICRDVTRDRVADMTVLVASGGAARVTAWVVFRARKTSWQLVLRRLNLYRASVSWVKGDLVETVAVLRKTDLACCPTGGHNHTRLDWQRGIGSGAGSSPSASGTPDSSIHLEAPASFFQLSASTLALERP